jgi:tetratricopeptide (TPR) repeat protein
MMSRRPQPAIRVVLVGAFFAAFALAAQAIYMQVDVENVPIARLVENLERLLKARPTDAYLHLNLARTHGMAWAQATATMDVSKRRDEWEPWFGYEHDAVPFTVAPTKDAARMKAAAPHLKAALDHYADAIRLDPNNLAALLGQAWLIDKSGNPVRAIPLYRAVIEKAWPQESRGRPMGASIVGEASRYLIPLLDSARDRAEIDALRARMKQIESMPRPITPIAIPLRDGLSLDEVVDLHARVQFDADGSGLRKTWTWIAPGAGWLVYNQRADSAITSALQLFGGVTFWLFWENGYDALRALDDNGDGELRGSELVHIAVWRDADRDGVSAADEVKPLRAWGITGISTRAEAVETGPAVAWSPDGVTLEGGRRRPTWDVLLYRSAR